MALAWPWSGRSPPKWNQWECWGPMWLGPHFSPTNFSLIPVSPEWGKRVGSRGSLWFIPSVTSGALRIPKEVPYHGQCVPHPLGLPRICLPFPSLPSPHSLCGSCPFTLGSGLISKISFCLGNFGPFVNDPPGPEIYLVNI